MAIIGKDRTTDYRLAIGKPYPTGKSPYPDGADYDFRDGRHELRIFRGKGIRKAGEAIRRSPVEFGLLAESTGMMLVARFGPSLSCACPYHWHHTAEVTGGPTMPPGPGAKPPRPKVRITTILIEAATGIVRAMREVSVSAEFTRALHRAISDQAAGPYDRAGHERWVDAMTRYSTDQLWQRCTIRCQGGT